MSQEYGYVIWTYWGYLEKFRASDNARLYTSKRHKAMVLHDLAVAVAEARRTWDDPTSGSYAEPRVDEVPVEQIWRAKVRVKHSGHYDLNGDYHENK